MEELADRRIYLFNEFNNDSTLEVVSRIHYLESADKSKDILLYLKSEGGDFSCLTALHDIIEACSCRIAIVGCGELMSSGAMLLMAGDKDLRFITPLSRIMLHPIQSSAAGSIPDMREALRELNISQNILERFIKEHCKIPPKLFNKLLNKEIYLSAEESLKYGIVDHILYDNSQLDELLNI
jgi:ATP-dependent Clp protease protease subunit